jgi:hypothetical protein
MIALRVFAATVLAITFALHWTIDGLMPDAGPGSLTLHQAYVIEETGLPAAISGCP